MWFDSSLPENQKRAGVSSHFRAVDDLETALQLGRVAVLQGHRIGVQYIPPREGAAGARKHGGVVGARVRLLSTSTAFEEETTLCAHRPVVSACEKALSYGTYLYGYYNRVFFSCKTSTVESPKVRQMAESPATPLSKLW